MCRGLARPNATGESERDTVEQSALMSARNVVLERKALNPELLNRNQVLSLLYPHAAVPEEFLAGLDRGVTRSALNAELAEAFKQRESMLSKVGLPLGLLAGFGVGTCRDFGCFLGSRKFAFSIDSTPDSDITTCSSFVPHNVILRAAKMPNFWGCQIHGEFPKLKSWSWGRKFYIIPSRHRDLTASKHICFNWHSHLQGCSSGQCSASSAGGTGTGLAGGRGSFTSDTCSIRIF